MIYSRWWCKHIRSIRTLGLWPLVPQTESLAPGGLTNNGKCATFENMVFHCSPAFLHQSLFSILYADFLVLLEQGLDRWVAYRSPPVPTPFIGASNHRSWKVSVVASTQALSCCGRTRASPGGYCGSIFNIFQPGFTWRISKIWTEFESQPNYMYFEVLCPNKLQFMYCL